MTARIPVKRGTDLSLACVWADSDDAPVNLTGLTVVATAARQGITPINLTVTVGNQTTTPGAFTISATAAETRDWVIGSLNVDIHVFSSGARDGSETFALEVIDSPSRLRT